ncbi:exported hypothetical protein [Nitrospina gracilis 3/211]|uniref:Uncharacterized protein n=1 Tax=Nitrospina gracilis (strain 3/211) TaxID=1266370 RepID=M1ZC47_NITG3|nr:exported hypothetical protein [Nitrospina gracilis 3/211]
MLFFILGFLVILGLAVMIPFLGYFFSFITPIAVFAQLISLIEFSYIYDIWITIAILFSLINFFILYKFGKPWLNSKL